MRDDNRTSAEKPDEATSQPAKGSYDRSTTQAKTYWTKQAIKWSKRRPTVVVFKFSTFLFEMVGNKVLLSNKTNLFYLKSDFKR